MRISRRDFTLGALLAAGTAGMPVFAKAQNGKTIALLFDSLVVSVLIYYSGGVYSWFYTIFALIVVAALALAGISCVQAAADEPGALPGRLPAAVRPVGSVEERVSLS